MSAVTLRANNFPARLAIWRSHESTSLLDSDDFCYVSRIQYTVDTDLPVILFEVV